MPLVEVETTDRDTGRIGSILLDVRISENHKFSNEVTNMPTEKGFSITDNIKEVPFKLSMTGFVTDSPISSIGLKKIQNGENGFVDETYNELLKLFKDRELVSVQTSLARYENMAIISCDIPRDKSTGESITFSMEFQQVIIVENEFTTVENNAKDVKKSSPKIKDRNDPKRSKGRQTVKKVYNKKAGGGSLLFGFFGK